MPSLAASPAVVRYLGGPMGTSECTTISGPCEMKQVRLLWYPPHEQTTPLRRRIDLHDDPASPAAGRKT